MKIQDIIDKFNKLPHGTLGEFDEDVIGFCEAEQFLQSSLTSLLDSIKGECNKVSSDGDTEWADGYNTKNQEVINIINSHR